MKQEDANKPAKKYNIDPSGCNQSKRNTKDFIVYFGTPSVYMNILLETGTK